MGLAASALAGAPAVAVAVTIGELGAEIVSRLGLPLRCRGCRRWTRFYVLWTGPLIDGTVPARTLLTGSFRLVDIAPDGTVPASCISGVGERRYVGPQCFECCAAVRAAERRGAPAG